MREEHQSRNSSHLSRYLQDRKKTLHLTIHCATWNVGASMPSTSDIAKVLELKNEYPDIYCIGLQEVVDLNVLNVAIRPNHAADRWERMIERVLDSKYNPHHKHANEGFSKICVQQMVGLLLLVYIRADLFPYVSEFQTDSLGVGMGRLGNKGAVAFRFKLFECTFVMVNSHFTAGREKLSRRNRDYADIVKNVCFMDTAYCPRTIFDSDVLLFMGDLNYRLEYELEEFKTVQNLISTGQYGKLVERDQLRMTRESSNPRRAFKYLSETGPLNFAPTYKRVPGKFEGYSHKRIPGWTDRIFYYETSVPLLPTRQEFKHISRTPTAFGRGGLANSMAKNPPGSDSSATAGTGASTTPKNPTLSLGVGTSPIHEVSDIFKSNEDLPLPRPRSRSDTNNSRVSRSKASRLSSFKPISYTSRRDCVHSDHRPVVAGFSAQILDPHGFDLGKDDNGGSGGALMLWSILEVAQFFVMLLELNFRYDKNIFEDLRLNYILGWSTGIFASNTLLSGEVSPDRGKPSREEIHKLMGLERLSWESNVNPNYIAPQALVTLCVVALIVIAICMICFQLTRLLYSVNSLRTAQARVYWLWTMYQSLGVILIMAFYPAFSLGSFHVSLCYGIFDFETELILSANTCHLGTCIAGAFGLMYAYIGVRLWVKVQTKRAYTQLFLHRKLKAVWGHFWRLYRYDAKFFALCDMCSRALQGVAMSGTTWSLGPLVLVFSVQAVLLVMIYILKPFKRREVVTSYIALLQHGTTAIVMKFIYWLRLTVCSIIFGFKVSDQQKYREIVSFVIIFGFFIALLLCLGNYLYHQGRKIALDLISIFAPCLKGSCTRWIAQGCGDKGGGGCKELVACVCCMC
eukprot:jgi/Bigna1/82716/fgenesh1_pg.96_\